MKTRAYLHDFLSLFFPEICQSCGNTLLKGEDIICTWCHRHLPVTDFHLDPYNPVAKIFWGRLPIEAATAFYYFRKGTRVQELLHHLKYSRQPGIGIKIGEWYGDMLKETKPYQSAELIVPVPLHPVRLRQRGYNQSACFAEGLSKTMNIELAADFLERSAYSETQTRKDRYHRFENVKTLFKINKKRMDEKVRHILLVDDVITTGATLEACANILFDRAGTKVSIATMATAL